MKKILSTLLALLTLLVFGQNSAVLSRRISLHLEACSLDSALEVISSNGKFHFSYSNKTLNSRKQVTVDAKDKSVGDILKLVLDKDISFKEKGNYVILQKKKEDSRTTVKGYITNTQTGKHIPHASVYDLTTLTSAVTDDDGYYKMDVPEVGSKIFLTVNKDAFVDTNITIPASGYENADISLSPQSAQEHVETKLDTPRVKRRWESFLGKQFNSLEAQFNRINIKTPIFRGSQISLLPYIGTNRLLSGNTSNKMSLNVIGGYSLGNEQVELGGVLNMNRDYVRGFQAAGMVNIVGGDVRGVQLAGIMNTNKKSTEGFQGAGVLNVNRGTVRGVQAAGALNVNIDTVSGVTMAGIANIHALQNKGLAVAGAFNHADKTKQGSQIAGIFNHVGNGDNVNQIAGLFNDADSGTTKLQIAGLFNYASHVKGVQLAPFNFSDSCSGAPIGVFSYVKHGLHQLEVSYDELDLLNLTFRSGVDRFYTLLTVGTRAAAGKNQLWSIGYGLGTNLKLSKSIKLNVDLTTSHLSKGAFYKEVNLLNKLYIGPEFKLYKTMTFGVGPTASLLISQSSGSDFSFFKDLPPYQLYTFNGSQGTALRGWVGGKVFLRFL